MEIRKSRIGDIERIMEIYHYAQDFMIASGNPTQWAHIYPKRELIEQDIADEISYVLCDGDIVLAVFALLFGDDPTYDVIDDGSWPNNEPYITIHRSASDGSTHGGVPPDLRFLQGSLRQRQGGHP